MKHFIFLLCLIYAHSLRATGQAPDILNYEDIILMLEVGWGHPSPLETYYQENNLAYPFEWTNTGNYRGHIAHWEIIDNKFYITEIEVEDDKFIPSKFDIKSQSGTNYDHKIFADWFTGVLHCTKVNIEWETEYSIYFLIKKGVINRVEKITPQELEIIENLKYFDELEPRIKLKYELLCLNESYIGYYFSLHSADLIKIGKKHGLIKGKNGKNIMLEYFENNHQEWPYNWDNTELSGAPKGTWEIIDNKLYLTYLDVNSTEDIFTRKKTNINLATIFKSEQIDDLKVLADWTNGIYLITHSEDNNEDDNTLDFFLETSDFTFLRIEKGKIIEQHNISAKIDWESDTIDPRLKKIFEDLKKQNGVPTD